MDFDGIYRLLPGFFHRFGKNKFFQVIIKNLGSSNSDQKHSWMWNGSLDPRNLPKKFHVRGSTHPQDILG